MSVPANESSYATKTEWSKIGAIAQIVGVAIAAATLFFVSV